LIGKHFIILYFHYQFIPTGNIVRGAFFSKKRERIYANKIVLFSIIRERTKVTDIVEGIKRLKWGWAGHAARFTDNRWTNRILQWCPRNEVRQRRRPNTKMER
jgi:hypothetical protein